MFSGGEFSFAMPIAKSIFERLQDPYNHLPETRCTCEDPGLCCTYLPEMTVVEAMQWIYLIKALPKVERTSMVKKFMAFFLTNPSRLTGCPFLVDGACTVYRHRTFGCRAYGLWSQSMGRDRTRESRNSKKALRSLWKRFGVELPPHPVEFEIDYCDKVEILGDKPIQDHTLLALLKQIYDLGAPLGDLQTRFEEAYHSDFSFLLTSLAIGLKTALLEKPLIIKEITQKGTDLRLQKVLEKI